VKKELVDYNKSQTLRLLLPVGIVNISVKQNVFPAWSSAWTYSGALDVMDYLVTNNLIQITNTGIRVGNSQYSGVAVNSTIGEVKKFCFNNNEIDYAIVNTFSSGDITSEVTKSADNTYSDRLKIKYNIW